MKISIVTDEVSSDLESALEIIRAWGLDAVELRGIGLDRYPEVPDYWHLRVPELVREAGLSVVAISPGLFQIPSPGRPPAKMGFSRRGDTTRVRQELAAQAQLDHHLNRLLPASIEAAQKLGAQTIICSRSADWTTQNATSPPRRSSRSCAMPPKRSPPRA